MVGPILAVLGGLLLVFVAVLLIRGALFRPPHIPSVDPRPVTVDREKVIADMVDMLRCRTVSHRDHTLEDSAEFKRFRALLTERFPRIHKACTLHYIGRNGLLYHLKGQQEGDPTVLMSHYDVVPVEEDGWTHPPFDGVIEDGVLWGRGALDTKSTLCGVMEALEQLLGEGYVPRQDLYLSFSGEEEIDGNTCADIVTWFEQRGIHPAMVVDEGGAVVEKVFPGVEGRCALIGIAEKGGVNLRFTLESPGGHSSTPPPHTVMGRLSRAVTRMEDHPFPYEVTPAVKQMFNTLGRHSGFLYRVIFANLWCFAPVLDILCRKSGGELNAMMRTTVAVTRMRGSDAYNVLPPVGSIGANLRLLGEDTVDSVMSRLDRVIDDEDIHITLVNGTNPSICSDTDCAQWDTLCQAVRETWPDAKISPYLMMACSDSRHYCRITDRVYRFSAMYMPRELRGLVHSHNERIPLDVLMETVAFYVRLLRLI